MITILKLSLFLSEVSLMFMWFKFFYTNELQLLLTLASLAKDTKLFLSNKWKRTLNKKIIWNGLNSILKLHASSNILAAL